MLLCTSNVSALGQILNNLLPGPTTWEQLVLRLGETPFYVRHKAIVSLGCAELVGVLKIHRLVGTTCRKILVKGRLDHDCRNYQVAGLLCRCH